MEFCPSNNFVHNSWLWPLGSYRINQLKTVAERYEKIALLSELIQWRSQDDDVSHILRHLYRYKRTRDRFTGTETVRHRVLGKLWDWTYRNGDVSLDVFPGFTYDFKTNGFMRTSFLWWFFRYEITPEQGSALDVLFLPVWR